MLTTDDAKSSARDRSDRGPAGKATLRQQRFRFYLLFLAMDGAALIAGFRLAGIDHHGLDWHYGRVDGSSLIAVLFVALAGSGFQPAMLNRWRFAARHSLWSAACAAVSVWAMCLVLRSPLRLAPTELCWGLAIAGLLIVVGHRLTGRIAARVFRGQPLAVALVRDDPTALRLPHVRTLCAEQLGLAYDVSHPLLLDRLSRSLRGVDIVYVACAHERRGYWAAMLRGSDVPAKFLIPELSGQSVATGDNPFGMVQAPIETDAMTTRDRIVKRLFDVTAAALLLVFFLPVLAAVALLIKLDSPGPVLFVQQRVGRGNLLFAMYKFRSMYAASCDGDGHRSTTRDDRRVTRIGRFLRRASIDELPQLLNVLKGDMSFVGPRPHALGSLAGDQLFWQVDDRYCARHVHKPGLTGLAQVRGLRGATHRSEDLVNRLQADLEYIDGWSMWRDLSILAATLKVVFHKNAY